MSCVSAHEFLTTEEIHFIKNLAKIGGLNAVYKYLRDTY